MPVFSGSGGGGGVGGGVVEGAAGGAGGASDGTAGGVGVGAGGAVCAAARATVARTRREAAAMCRKELESVRPSAAVAPASCPERPCWAPHRAATRSLFRSPRRGNGALRAPLPSRSARERGGTRARATAGSVLRERSPPPA